VVFPEEGIDFLLAHIIVSDNYHFSFVSICNN